MNANMKDYLEANVLSSIFSWIFLKNSKRSLFSIMLFSMVFLGYRMIRIIFPKNHKKEYLQSIRQIIPIMKSYDDVVEEITKNYIFENQKYIKLDMKNPNWRNNIKNISFLVNEKNGSLRIFIEKQDREAKEIMHGNLVIHTGLDPKTLMDVENLKTIYVYLRQNYL